MTIKFILAKFAEISIKLFIGTYFIISTLIFTYFIIKIGLNFSIDYWKVEICVDVGGGWNKEKRLCRFGLDIE
jgi:hypothetical protein